MQVQEMLESAAVKWPEKNALWYNSQTMSYGVLNEKSNRFANWLKKKIKRGDRVSFLIENSFYHVIVYFGILKAGGTAVAMNPLLSSEILQYQIENSDSCIFITQLKQLRKLVDMINNCPIIKTLVLDGDPKNIAFPGKEKAFFDEILALSSVDNSGIRGIDLDLAEIVYTSGSTGQPKGVMLSHMNLCSNMKSIASYLHLTGNDKIMVVLPFYYIYGKSLLLTHFLVGGEVLIDNRFMYPNKVLEAMEETEATGFAGVPSTFTILLNKSNLKSHNLSSLRYVTQAGGGMAPAIQKEVVKWFSPALLYIMYGATEAAPRLSYLEPDQLEKKWGSIGMAVDNVDLIIADENGHEYPQGEEGEIAARGSNIMIGYWKDPEETAKVLRNGYYYTGDLGYKDKDGYIFITGRSKNFIKVKGFRVSAKEIEDKILEKKEVHEIAVIAAKDDMMGEIPVAFIVLKENMALSEEDLKGFLSSRLANYKIPQKIIFRDDLPKNESGKIMKKQLSI